MGDLGMSLIKLANYEEQEGGKCGQYTDIGLEARAIATDSRRIGAAAVRYRRLGRVAVGYLTQALAPLHDELALTPAALGALKERESALVTTHLIRDDIEKKRAAAVALEEAGALRFGGSSTKAKRVTQLQNEAAAAEATLTVAQTEYDRIKSRNVEVRSMQWHAYQVMQAQHECSGCASGSPGCQFRSFQVVLRFFGTGTGSMGTCQGPGLSWHGGLVCKRLLQI